MRSLLRIFSSLFAVGLMTALVVALFALRGQALPAQDPRRKAPPTAATPESTPGPDWTLATRIAAETMAAWPTVPSATPFLPPQPLPPGTPLAETMNVLSPDNVAGLSELASIHYGSGPQPLYGLFLSPDARLLAVDVRGGRVWDLPAGRERAALWPPGPDWQRPTDMHPRGFTPDGRYLLVEAPLGLRLWGTLDGAWSEPPVTVAGMQEFTASPDGRWLAWVERNSGGSTGDAVVVARAGDWQEVQRFAHDEGGAPVRRLAFSHDGTLLAVADQEGWLEVWSLGTGRQVLSGQSQRWYPDTLAFFPGDRLLLCATGESSEVLASYPRIWDVSTGRVLIDWPIQEDSNRLKIALSPDGTLAASGGTWDGAVVLWDLRNPAAPRRIATLQAHTSVAGVLQFSAGGRLLVTGSDDGTVKVWAVR